MAYLHASAREVRAKEPATTKNKDLHVSSTIQTHSSKRIAAAPPAANPIRGPLVL
jgi:hypothetical protein